uniref:Uncharacterized protein n=1 Tax=Mesocestoides corti TaxID=53468 RepID=A0A5K3EJU2_MESCO
MYHQLFWASADEDFSSTNPTCEESDPTEWQTNCPSARHGCALTGSTPTEQHGVDTFLLHEFSLSWTKVAFTLGTKLPHLQPPKLEF